MATSKHIERICIGAVILALVITILLMNGNALGIQAKAQKMGYEDRLFDASRVHTIDIVMEDWDAFLATAQNEEYSACNVVIDGETFQSVGIRGKGNASLSTVADMDSQRYSFKIEFDQYDSTKNYYGLDKLSLNNLIQDNTMMKDYLTYQMMAEFDVAAPLCSYVYITVNGEDWGLYLAVEAVEESFLQRNYGSNYGHLYKPDSTNMVQDQAAMQAEMPPQNKAENSSGTNDVMLQYIDANLSSYGNIFTGAKTDATTADHQRLVDSLLDLSEQRNLEQVLDVEAVLRYFVVHNFTVNADSYTGSMVHNYYLYEKDGQLSMIPWDYNLAYGTFRSKDSNGAVNDDIDAPLSVTGNDRPMIDWFLDSEEYTARYHAYFREFLDTVDSTAIIAQARELIDPYVKKDPTKFCTYAEFEQGVQTLTAFCDLRSQSIAAQLGGEDGTVDASAITLSDMGTINQSGEQKPTKPEKLPENATGHPTGDMQQIPEGEGIQPPGGMENMTQGQNPAAQRPDIMPAILFGVSVLILLGGLLFAWKFKR